MFQQSQRFGFYFGELFRLILIVNLLYRLKGTSCLQDILSVSTKPVRSGPSKLEPWRSWWRTCWRLLGTMTLPTSASFCQRTEALPPLKRCLSCCWTGKTPAEFARGEKPWRGGEAFCGGREGGRFRFPCTRDAEWGAWGRVTWKEQLLEQVARRLFRSHFMVYFW